MTTENARAGNALANEIESLEKLVLKVKDEIAILGVHIPLAEDRRVSISLYHCDYYDVLDMMTKLRPSIIEILDAQLTEKKIELAELGRT